MRPNLFFLLLFALTASICDAQTGTGFPPFGSFQNSEFDTINEGNLNIHFAIPVVNKPGRGLPFRDTITYNGIIWGSIPGGASYLWQPPNLTTFGWNAGELTSSGYNQAIGGFVTYTTRIPTNCPNPPHPLVLRENYVYHDTAGTNHFFGGQAVEQDCNGVPHGFATAAQDNSGYSISVDSIMAVSITTVGGVLIHPIQSGGSNPNPQLPRLVTDTNGNQITYDASAGAYTDTLGTVALKLVRRRRLIQAPPIRPAMWGRR